MKDVKIESVRDRMHSASSRIARVKLIDRAARVVISLGGFGVVVSVLFIFLFILGQAWPLWRPATTTRVGAAVEASGLRGALIIGSDEYQKKLFGLLPEGSLTIADLATGAPGTRELAPGLNGATVTAGARNATGALLTLGTSDGRAGLVHLRFQPVYESSSLKDVSSQVVFEPLVEMDAAHRPLRLVDGRERDGASVLAAVANDRDIVVLRRTEERAAYERHALPPRSVISRTGAMSVRASCGRSTPSSTSSRPGAATSFCACGSCKSSG